MSEPLGGPDRAWLIGEAGRLLDDARRAARPGGGFGWLTATGSVDPTRGRPLWITTRMVHCLALGELLGRRADGDLVEAGITALLAEGANGYRDGAHGGWFEQPGVSSTKSAYAHAFVVLAGASASAAGHNSARALLDQALAVQNDHFWDDDTGAVVEDWAADWSANEAYRGANANMHTVEAYLTAADVTGERLWRDRALRICERLIDSGARSHDWRVPEHFDADWQVQPEYNRDFPAHPFRPYGATPGHGLEWARLLLHLQAGMGEKAPVWLRPAAEQLYQLAITDGWDSTHGGICYTTDWTGKPVVRQHFHWVMCEAIATAALLWRVSGEARYAADYQKMWEYAQAHYLDGRAGWQHEVDPDGTPSSVTWAGRPDIYHALQATLVPLLPLTPAFAPALATVGLAS